MSVFEGKTLLITGGTGSFGNAVLRRFLTSDIKEIRIFSRDEKKQDDMRHHLQAQYPEAASKVKFYIGMSHDENFYEAFVTRAEWQRPSTWATTTVSHTTPVTSTMANSSQTEKTSPRT